MDTVDLWIANAHPRQIARPRAGWRHGPGDTDARHEQRGGRNT